MPSSLRLPAVRLVRSIALCSSLIATFVGGRAMAQSPPRPWVEGRLVGERDASFGIPSAGVVFGAAVGIDGRRAGVRFEADVPPLQQGTVISSYADGPVRVRTTARWRRHSPGWAVAGAWTPIRGNRLSVSAIAGWANVAHRSAPDVVVVERLASDGTVLQRQDYSSVSINRWWPGVVVGMDVATAIGRLAIVPELRLIAFPLSDVQGDYILRGGVACRWRF